jgi:hypothetical protein
VKTSSWLAALLLCCSGALQAQEAAPAPGSGNPGGDEHGAYLSLGFGDGRTSGGNSGGDAGGGSRWMGRRAFEARAGRDEPTRLGPGRIDFVHYNEGHPDNNHRDGFALQWVGVRPLGSTFMGELGIGPYLSMNTTSVGGTQIDDSNWGVLLSIALRLPLETLPAGTHLRLGLNHALIPGAHRSTALILGIGRQFGPAQPRPDTEPVTGPWWFGASVGRSITNLDGTDGANAATLEARKYLDESLAHWAVSGKLVFEGDDNTRVDRDGVAGQVWYVQQVTPRLAVSTGIGPYLARNDRDEDHKTRANLLISFQAERALSRQIRAFVNFNRVKTFRQTNDRDLFQVGLLKRF